MKYHLCGDCHLPIVDGHCWCPDIGQTQAQVNASIRAAGEMLKEQSLKLGDLQTRMQFVQALELDEQDSPCSPDEARGFNDALKMVNEIIDGTRVVEPPDIALDRCVAGHWFVKGIQPPPNPKLYGREPPFCPVCRLDTAMKFVRYTATRYEEGWPEPVTAEFYEEARQLLFGVVEKLNTSTNETNEN